MREKQSEKEEKGREGKKETNYANRKILYLDMLDFFVVSNLQNSNFKFLTSSVIFIETNLRAN